MRRLMYLGSAAAAALLAASALSGCDRSNATAAPPLAALPPVAGPAAPLAIAPTAANLPPAPAAPVTRLADPGQAYAYADDAWAMDAAFADSPPDFYFDDDGASPWVWVADDGSERVAEAVPGGERYFFYRPGADEPYFVQDPDYGYGFDGGALVVVYDREGRLVPNFDQDRDMVAGRFLARGHALRVASGQFAHRPVAADTWSQRRDTIAAQRTDWARQSETNPAWNAFHAQHGPQEASHWADESHRREAWAAQQDTRFGHDAVAQHETQLAQAPKPLTPAGAPPTPPKPVFTDARPVVTPGHPPIPPGTGPAVTSDHRAHDQQFAHGGSPTGPVAGTPSPTATSAAHAPVGGRPTVHAPTGNPALAIGSSRTATPGSPAFAGGRHSGPPTVEAAQAHSGPPKTPLQPHLTTTSPTPPAVHVAELHHTPHAPPSGSPPKIAQASVTPHVVATPAGPPHVASAHVAPPTHLVQAPAATVHAKDTVAHAPAPPAANTAKDKKP